MGIHFDIQGREIGPGNPAYIVAEMSANHNHSIEEAEKIVRMAKECGADAIKLQTYTPDTLTIDCDNNYFRIGKGSPWEGRKLYELYGEAFTPWEWQPHLMNVANEIGIQLFSTPFDAAAVDFLEELDVPAHKVASFEMIDHELLAKVAATGKPVIMSTGMASLDEIDESVSVLRKSGCEQLALLKCTSAYPSPPEEMHLRTIADLEKRFKTPAGLSDHTLGTTIPIAAVALGANILEKHFTLSRDTPGPDSAFSLEPDEFAAMVQAVRTAEAALGCVSYELSKSEKSSRVFRRSLFAVQDIGAGEPFTRSNVRSIRPGHGLSPRSLLNVLESVAARDIARGTPLAEDMLRDAVQ